MLQRANSSSCGFGDGTLVKCVTKHDIFAIPDSLCSHEEVDTRIIMHAIDLYTSFKWVMVHSDDTDVLVMLLY